MPRLASRRHSSSRSLLVACVVAAGTLAHPTAQQPLKVLASNNVRPVLEMLHQDLERQLHTSITLGIDTSSALRARINAGEAFDVAVLIPEAVAALTSAGHLAPGAVEIVRSEIGVALRGSAPAAAIRTDDDLRALLTRATAIAYLKDGASRAPIGRMLEHFGVPTSPPTVTLFDESRIPESVETLGADVVILRTNQLELVRGATVIRALPPEWQGYVHIQAAVSARTSQHAASEALISALQTPRAKSLFYANDQENQ